MTVLKCPMFYVVLVTYIIYNYNFDVFMTTVPDFAIDRGTSVVDAVGLVPLFSITDTVGRLGLPVLADRGYLRRSTLVMFNYLLMGMCLFALPWATSYASILLVCLCEATFVGCGMTMYPALMAEYIGLDRLPISYGIVGTIAGPLFLLKPFLIGELRIKKVVLNGTSNDVKSCYSLATGTAVYSTFTLVYLTCLMTLLTYFRREDFKVSHLKKLCV
ncbi:hypothetical protein HPB48_016058 [Haemaphysalis longicornis]|uniref:Monocarboxylate transporter n=1 Tax=Haemaphysalis longicornis TaxID=44386 RepID=A0A9J6GRI4_HAELO|nr:hypothetical protein HPB48_016058 [Haemaphysalis longicornis]